MGDPIHAHMSDHPNLPWYRRDPRDWLGDTMDLDLRHEGAYSRLTEWYYINGPIPNESRQITNISRVIHRRNNPEYVAVMAILNRYFYLGLDGRWHHKRCDREIAHATERLKQTRFAAAKGGRASAQARAQASAQASATPKTQAPAQPNGSERDIDRGYPPQGDTPPVDLYVDQGTDGIGEARSASPQAATRARQVAPKSPKMSEEERKLWEESISLKAWMRDNGGSTEGTVPELRSRMAAMMTAQMHERNRAKANGGAAADAKGDADEPEQPEPSPPGGPE